MNRCGGRARLNVRYSPDAYVYAITDAQLTEFHYPALCQRLKQGVGFLQYRDKSKDSVNRLKQAKLLKRVCQRTRTRLIINDDWVLARRIGADGIHLGKQDARVNWVRRQSTKRFLIGCSCYNDLHQAKRYVQQGVDYVAFGALYVSSTKPEAPQASLQCLALGKTGKTLCVGIGGIDFNRLPTVIRSGAHYGAMVSAFWQQP